ncbi:MAG: hypothetical protein JXQ73_31065 [Phycisphaerae bacterium]|nr:hypothetical protein [Phycisphaerae bacterium]
MLDRRVLNRYRDGGYVHQAPYGLFADHHGRMIQFCLSMHRLAGDARWLGLAREVADAAIKEPWREKLFVGHVEKSIYANVDQVGMLLYALLQLDGALGGHGVGVEGYFWARVSWRMTGRRCLGFVG